MENLIYFIFFIYFMYCQEEMLFYKKEKKYCKKYNGNCDNCECWSCHRLDHIKKGE